MELKLKWEESKRKLLDIIKTYNVPLDKIVLAFSGGKDSMVCYTMLKELDLINKVRIVFSNTKMEFDAINDFIKSVEGVEILENKTALPLVYREFGVPLHSKFSSEMISRLQKHNFNFKDDMFKSYDELISKYPKCKVALSWLTQRNIKMNCPQWLRKVLVDLDFKVSAKCCYKLKKEPFAKFNKDNKILINILGVRKAEGGTRSFAYKSCFYKKGKVHYYLPILDYTDDEIATLIKEKNIPISKAYTLYGCERTGCVGCPFSKHWERERDT